MKIGDLLQTPKAQFMLEVKTLPLNHVVRYNIIKLAKISNQGTMANKATNKANKA